MRDMQRVKEIDNYKLFFDHAKDIILIIAEDGKIVDVNEAAILAYGYDYGIFITLKIFDLRLETTHVVSNQMRTASSEGIKFETMHKRRDGSSFPVEVNAYGVTSNDEKLLISIVRDITERKTAEKELLRLIEELKVKSELEHNLSQVSRKLLDNNHFETAMAYAFQQLGSCTNADGVFLLLMNEDKRTMNVIYEWEKDHQFDIKQKYQCIEAKEFEHWIKKMEETKCVLYSDTSLIPDSEMSEKNIMMTQKAKSVITIPIIVSNLVAGFMYVYTVSHYNEWKESIIDYITTISEMIILAYNTNYIEEKLKEKNIELQETLALLTSTQLQLISQEKLAGIGQLAAGIAHEINNPLGFLISNTEILNGYIKNYDVLLNEYRIFKSEMNDWGGEAIPKRLEELNALEKQNNIDFIQNDITELLKDSNDGLERISKIVKSLRWFSRSEQDNQYEEYDFNEGIRNTLVVAKNEVKYCAEVEEHLEPIPYIKALSGQINQVLLNLIINAVHAIKEKNMEGMGAINIHTFNDADYVYCEIEDNGMGISEENKSKILLPFFTTKQVGRGTGLGLSISYDIIVNKHKGELSFISTTGVGTKFMIKLPIEQEDTLSYS